MTKAEFIEKIKDASDDAIIALTDHDGYHHDIKEVVFCGPSKSIPNRENEILLFPTYRREER